MIWQKLDSMLSISHMTISTPELSMTLPQDVAKSDIPHTFALKPSSLKSMYCTSRAWNHQNYFHRIEFHIWKFQRSFSSDFRRFFMLDDGKISLNKTKEVHRICFSVKSSQLNSYICVIGFVRQYHQWLYKIHRHVSPNRWRMMIHN